MGNEKKKKNAGLQREGGKRKVKLLEEVKRPLHRMKPGGSFSIGKLNTAEDNHRTI